MDVVNKVGYCVIDCMVHSLFNSLPAFPSYMILLIACNVELQNLDNGESVPCFLIYTLKTFASEVNQRPNFGVVHSQGFDDLHHSIDINIF